MNYEITTYDDPNHYYISDENDIVAEFYIRENSWDFYIDWVYGQEELPIDVISEVNQIQYKD